MGFCVSTLVYGMSCGLFGSPGSTNPNSKCFTSSDGSFDLASLGDRDRDLQNVEWKTLKKSSSLYIYLCRRLFLLNVVTSSDSVSAPEFTYPSKINLITPSTFAFDHPYLIFWQLPHWSHLSFLVAFGLLSTAHQFPQACNYLIAFFDLGDFFLLI